MRWPDRERPPRPRPPTPPDRWPQMPRQIKYAWGLLVSLLLTVSLTMEGGSDWLPLVHRAIDLLQQMAPISDDRSNTTPTAAPPPPNGEGSCASCSADPSLSFP